MSNEFFDIDSILEEFSSYSADLSGQDVTREEPEQVAQPRQNTDAEQPPRYEEPQQQSYYEEPSQNNYFGKPQEAPYYDAPRQAGSFEEPRESEYYAKPREERRFSAPVPQYEEKEYDEDEGAMRPLLKLPAFLSRRRDNALASPGVDEDEYGDEFDEEDNVSLAEVKPEKLRIGGLRHVVSLICAVVTVLGLFWLASNIHPDIGVSETMRTDAKMDLVSKIDVFANNAKSDALGDLAFIRKIYTIDRSALCAPKPNPNGFHTYSIEEADRVMELVQNARDSGLLEGQDIIFDPDTKFYWDSNIQCYYDSTILVICWKEQINERVCSCVEIKIADASQFRRKLTEDYFGSSLYQYNTQMAASVNAIASMNADYYSFRPYGVVVYQGEIFRYQTTVDTMFIDDKGDFSFLHRFDDPGQEALQQRIYENHIQFSLAFGPVLIENGEVQHLTDNYGGLGEMNQQYSRAGIGQFDTLHYLYMTVNWSSENTPRAKVNEFADIMATKNLKHAYNLDGGQTSEIVFNGSRYNYVDYDAERAVSDCIYFGSAIPESEVSG